MEGNAVRLLRGLLREPLVHFCIAGVAIFGVYYWFSDREPEALPDGQVIEISADDIRQIVVAWLAQGRLPLTPDQLQSLVDQKIAEEVLYREGVALGLDRNDEIIRRRIVQKMDFLAADVAAMQEPNKAELMEWFSRNASRFAIPPRASFRHLYFSPDKRGAASRSDAEAALDVIAGEAADSLEVAAVADPFMLRSYYRDSTPDQLLKEFGPAFAVELFKLDPGGWRGPVQSGYGWHLVRIEQMEPGRVPAFEEVEAEVRAAWTDARYQEIRRTVMPSLDRIDLSNLMGAEPATTSSQPVPR